jgi:Transposase DDE domain group 1
MGDGEKAPLRLQFNPKVRLEFRGAAVTSDAGFLAVRELDDALGLTHIASDYLQESRPGRNIQHHLIPLLRQSIYSRLAGYDDTNDAERLSQDPAMKVVVGWQGSDQNAASTNTMSRFETETLTQVDNLHGLARMNSQWVEDAMTHTPHRRVILDLDSSESPVHGHQEGASYNGHFESVCYHPLFLFNQFGDCEGATLRPGNVHSAEGWQELLEPVVKGYQRKGLRLLFRGDAAFAKPEVYEYLEQEEIGYVIRLAANAVLQGEVAHLLVRPTEWPSRKPIVSYHDFTYQAQSWQLPRRVIAKIEWHQGELFPRVGFIVTNLSYPPKGIVRFYNGRGTAEQWIKEGKYALNWTRLSCHKFVANQVRLWLFILAYNLGNFMRRLALPEAMKHWSLSSLQTRLIKTGGRLVRHARRLVFQLAEVLVSREMLAGMLERIGRIRLAPG